MFRTIVVGYDGSAQSDDALALAAQLRDPDGGPLIVATVMPLARGVLLTSPDDHVRNLLDAAQHELARAEVRLGSSTPHELVPIGDTSPGRGLDRLAEERHADLIVLGSTHHGGAGIHTGRATVQRLLHGAPCPVAVAAPGQQERFGSDARICVAYDASPEARRALDAAYAIATTTGALVEILHVVEGSPSSFGVTPRTLSSEVAQEAKRAANRELDEAIAQAPAGVFAQGRLLHGKPGDTLATTAETADLIVAGSRSYGPLHRVMAGSVSIDLLTNGRVPVLVMPRTHGPAQTAAVPAAAVSAHGGDA